MPVVFKSLLWFDAVIKKLNCYRLEQHDGHDNNRITLTNASFNDTQVDQYNILSIVQDYRHDNDACDGSAERHRSLLSRQSSSGSEKRKTETSNKEKSKGDKLGRSFSLIGSRPSNRTTRRSQSCKMRQDENLENKFNNELTRSLSKSKTTIQLREKKTCDVAVQTRLSLDKALIEGINAFIKELETEDEGDDDSIIDDPMYSDILGENEEEWPDSEEENEDGSYEGKVEKKSSESKEDVLEKESQEEEYVKDQEEEEETQEEVEETQEEVVALQSVLPSLQGRRGAVHAGINVTENKDRFKLPFMLKRKNERKLSRTELSEMVKEFRSDKPHPLDRLKMSHWSELMTEESQPEIKSTEYKRRDALWGLFRAELVYLTDQLKIIRDVFQGTLKIAKDNGLLSDIDESTLFPNVNKLYKVSNAFSLDLYKMFTEGNAEDDSVVAAFDEFAKKFHQPFQRYCLNYTRAAKYLKALSKDRDFREYEKVCLEDARCKKRQLSDLLICPMQHLMRYVILLQDIAKHVPENGKMELRDAIETIQISLRSLESKLGTLQNFQRLQELDTLIIWPKVVEMDKTVILPEELKAVLCNDQSETTLCSDGRHMLHAGALVSLEYPKSTEVHTFLFDDMLLLTRTNTSLRKVNRSIVFPIKTETQNTCPIAAPQSQGLMDVMETSGGLYDPKKRYLVYKQPISLDELLVHDINSAPGGCKHCFSITTFNRLKYCTGVYTFNAHSADNKNLWMNSIRKASEEFIISHPPTPITSRQRSGSRSGIPVCRGNSDVSSAGSRNSIVGQLKEQMSSVKKGNSLKNPTMRQQKLPKRCKSS